MSVSAEVQRTLVKSPPELWTELSSPESLARHLGEIGEIRVTKVEPETRVEWEADQLSGVVELKQSGWGTKVTLSLTHMAPEPEPASEPVIEASVAEAVAKPRAETLAPPHAPEQTDAEPDLTTAEPEPTVVREVRPEPEPVAEVVVAEVQQRGGFFARLFKRKPHPPLSAEPAGSSEPDPEPEIEALALPYPVYPPAASKPFEIVLGPVEASEPTADPAAELAEIEARMLQESTELLSGVLDRLGAAHHRPFSRA
jgi:hypothetical protein